jgi:RNA polymerase sigma factor (sigma-70 family)
MSQENASADEATARLDEINTRWSLMRLAVEASFTDSGPARQTLVLRYNGAIRKYIGAIVPNQQDADDLAQETLVRILRGDFAGADPERGRFRDLLKVALRNMARTFWSKQQKRAGAPVDLNLLGDDSQTEETERDWQTTWQNAVLSMTWRSLEAYEQSQPGCVAHTVLRLRSDHPDDDSEQLAKRLSTAVGRLFAAAATRQQLRRARLRFAQLLVEEVARGLKDPSPDRVEEELRDLGLFPYVADFLTADWKSRGELRAVEAADA